ncbi:hypothetical protein P8X24_03455 [Pyrococcus kukulkanii]|uniref:AAA family ATPase n=1 Tax=Pyrococcus kukulkanii TaxID=1609559 RepID=UPI0035685F92
MFGRCVYRKSFINDYIITITQKFVDREEELRTLRKAFERGSLVIIYGRRRVRKTRLLVEASKDFRTLYHLCKEEEIHETLKTLNAKLFSLTNDISLLKHPIKSFYEFFERLPEDVVVIFDEFQILTKYNTRTSRLQRKRSHSTLRFQHFNDGGFDTIWQPALWKEDSLPKGRTT